MRKMIAVGIVTSVALTVGGCGDYNPWGTPTPSQPAPTCSRTEVAAPPVTDPLSARRPAEVPPGWRWVVIVPEVRALKPNDTAHDYCVPFAVHLYGTMAGGPVLTLFDGVPHPLPYDRTKLTPWTGSYLILAYDPTSPRMSVPPEYDIQLIATYLAERDQAVAPPAAFRCVLKVNGATVVQDLQTLPGTGTVRCTLRNSFYNL